MQNATNSVQNRHDYRFSHPKVMTKQTYH